MLTLFLKSFPLKPARNKETPTSPKQIYYLIQIKNSSGEMESKQLNPIRLNFIKH